MAQGMEFLSLSGFDLVVIGVLMLSALIGLSRGITKEVLSIAAWVVAAAATYRLYPDASAIARNYISPSSLADIAAGVGVFVLTLILLSMVFGAITNRVKGSVLGPVDRSLGVLFGLGRGALLVCLAYLVMALLLPPIDRPVFVRNGQTKPLVEQGAILLYDLAPLSHKGNGEARIRGVMPNPVEPVPDDAAPLVAPKPIAPPPGTTETRAPGQNGVPDKTAETGYKPEQAKSMDQLVQSHREK